MFTFHLSSCITLSLNSAVLNVFLQEVEYAIEVVLSDESRYTIYRTLKEVATLNVSLPYNNCEWRIVRRSTTCLSLWKGSIIIIALIILFHGTIYLRPKCSQSFHSRLATSKRKRGKYRTALWSRQCLDHNEPLGMIVPLRSYWTPISRNCLVYLPPLWRAILSMASSPWEHQIWMSQEKQSEHYH